MLWPWKGSQMKMQTRILDNRLYYTRKIELHRKGKKSHTVCITPIVICLLATKSLVLVTVRRVHYSKMGKVPTTIYIYIYTWLNSIDILCLHIFTLIPLWKSMNSTIHPPAIDEMYVFTNHSAWVGWNTRSIFKQGLTDLNSEFSFS